MFLSKLKFFSFALAVILGLTVFYLASQKENQIEISFNKTASKAEKNAPTNETNKDADNDGLKDWEEKIYGTDPYNPDSDGDGYLDGKEIANGYNPLIKAPGDKLTDFPLNSTGNKTIAPQNNEENDNLTNKLIATLIQKITDLNKDRKNNDKKGIKMPSINNLITEFIAQKVSPEEYNFSVKENEIDLKKIKISKDNSKEAIRKYLTSFKSIIDRNFYSSKKSAKDIIKDAYQSGDFTEFDNLLLAYEKAIEEFYNLTVPSGWAALHQEEIKLLLRSQKVFKALRQADKDYLKAQLAIRGYYLVAFQSLDLKKQINNKVLADKIY